ncbi:MAG: large subunit ribosomal protein L13 [Bradymonadia bacterium]|jgi:large subunit ribosomal protein L13
MKTVSITETDAQRAWYVVDLEGVIVGRAATQIASILRGKNKPTYTPHTDTGDFVVVLNADKVKFTGNKLADKRYYRHSGYPGGIYNLTAAEMLEKHPERIIEAAVKGMLPKNKLGRHMLKKLKVYASAEHPHSAQQPQPLTLD